MVEARLSWPGADRGRDWVRLSMVWFHALQDGTWHYVEAGVYR